MAAGGCCPGAGSDTAGRMAQGLLAVLGLGGLGILQPNTLARLGGRPLSSGQGEGTAALQRENAGN